MMSTERKRIAQLRHGQVPKGYQMTRFGIVPSDWMTFRVCDCLERVERSVEVQADEFYTQIGIRSHGKGLFYKEQVAGVELGNKAVFWIVPDCFILNIVFAWEQAIGKTTQAEVGMIGSHRFPMYRPVKDRVDIDYLISFFLTKRGTDILEAASPGGAGRNKTLGQDRFLKSKIVLPPLPEQRKIAAILATQDKVIELYERKIEQLQLLKKNCLRKMFPRHGSDTPEVRFRGFTGTWERKKLGDLCHFSKGYGYSKSDLKPSGKPIILYGRLYTRHETEIVEVDTFAEANNESVYSRGGDVIIPASGETAEDISIASVVKQTGVIIGGDINIIEPESTLDSTSLAISISNAHPHADIARLAQGKSVVNLHCGDLAKVVLSYPCHSEQMKISTFFRHIDNIITLNQRKCDEEKQKKKALMQLLLTGIVRVGEAASCRLERAGNEAAGSRFSTRIANV